MADENREGLTERNPDAIASQGYDPICPLGEDTLSCGAQLGLILTLAVAASLLVAFPVVRRGCKMRAAEESSKASTSPKGSSTMAYVASPKGSIVLDLADVDLEAQGKPSPTARDANSSPSNRRALGRNFSMSSEGSAGTTGTGFRCKLADARLESIHSGVGARFGEQAYFFNALHEAPMEDSGPIVHSPNRTNRHQPEHLNFFYDLSRAPDAEVEAIHSSAPLHFRRSPRDFGTVTRDEDFCAYAGDIPEDPALQAPTCGPLMAPAAVAPSGPSMSVAAAALMEQESWDARGNTSCGNAVTATPLTSAGMYSAAPPLEGHTDFGDAPMPPTASVPPMLLSSRLGASEDDEDNADWGGLVAAGDDNAVPLPMPADTHVFRGAAVERALSLDAEDDGENDSVPGEKHDWANAV